MVRQITILQLKFKCLLNKFLEAKCHNGLEEALEKLLKYFYRLETKDCTLLTLPLFTTWIKTAVKTWRVQKKPPPSVIVTFVLNLTSLLSKKEEKFCQFSCDNFFIKLIRILNQINAEPEVQLAYIKLLTSFLEHRPGVEFLISSALWEDVYQLSLSNETQIVKESTKFISKFLDTNESFCNKVVKTIMSPLGENVSHRLKLSNEESKSDFESTLRLIGHIFELVFERALLEDKDFQVADFFLEEFKHQELYDNLLLMSEIDGFSVSFLKIKFVKEFLDFRRNVRTKNNDRDIVSRFYSKIQKDLLSYITDDNFDDTIELGKFSVLYWKYIELNFPREKSPKQYCMSVHFLGPVIFPHLFIVLKHFVSWTELDTKYADDDCRYLYFSEHLKMVHSDFFRFGSKWRNKFIARTDIVDLCMKSFDHLKDLEQHFSKDGALFIFNKLIYTIKDMFTAATECPKKLEILDNNDYFTEMFKLLATLVGKFQLTWKDNVEVINMITISYDFLKLRRWPANEVVQALNLINVAVRNYLSPNMLLLVDVSSDSTLELLGPLLSAKLVGTKCVKIAALEVIHSMAHMSRGEFPSLQKVLMDSELPTLVVKMSTCDSESFVRATAIKCLQEMIQVEEIWNNALKSEDLPQKMRDVLLNETEGIVRVEAATFMCVAYENQQFPKDTLDRVYETMIYASTTDLHWEVKVRALDFWDKVIKNHLQNQGMIDGSFPNVTFSKEHRKIVTLTDSEIRKRLLKVLSQLSSIGCLGVLMSAIKDDCDMEVSKTAAKITQRLVELFKKYNVRSDGSTPTSPLPTENGMSTASVSSGISVDESMDSPSNHHELNEDIIDQIVNSKDVCLLRNVYAPSEYSSVSNYDIQVRRVVTPNEFLQFTQQDLNTIISEKKNWLNGIEDLGSLLDDMLKTYEDDVNNMDCY
ncbi:uncharacterized protein LOC100141760 isoform X11 [Tribolium castaneum]|uniref:uncharacterized protein LOC100141760 isoform X11 n=1 Tax=Tribolium castaneum TaxID=7070 RepID=UPI00046BF8C3|nr:PREDICTED: uncharacterized protein LOC100141760 isoform X11 [Tribolium castaneum]|eukprot:XP_008197118.1 PREDICTED: uncharacterized protein LOC100141760 isoform X11 [Tribolium castaneum]